MVTEGRNLPRADECLSRDRHINETEFRPEDVRLIDQVVLQEK